MLRNYESLPEKPVDSDYFDLILVASQELDAYVELVYKFANANLKVIKKIDREYCKTTV